MLSGDGPTDEWRRLEEQARGAQRTENIVVEVEEEEEETGAEEEDIQEERAASEAGLFIDRAPGEKGKGKLTQQDVSGPLPN